MKCLWHWLAAKSFTCNKPPRCICKDLQRRLKATGVGESVWSSRHHFIIVVENHTCIDTRTVKERQPGSTITALRPYGNTGSDQSTKSLLPQSSHRGKKTVNKTVKLAQRDIGKRELVGCCADGRLAELFETMTLIYQDCHFWFNLDCVEPGRHRKANGRSHQPGLQTVKSGSWWIL